MTYKQLQKLYREQTNENISIATISNRAKEFNRLPTIDELKRRPIGRPAKYGGKNEIIN